MVGSKQEVVLDLAAFKCYMIAPVKNSVSHSKLCREHARVCHIEMWNSRRTVFLSEEPLLITTSRKVWGHAPPGNVEI